MEDEIEERIKCDYQQLLFYTIHVLLKTVNHNSSVNLSDSLSTEPDCNAYTMKTPFVKEYLCKII